MRDIGGQSIATVSDLLLEPEADKQAEKEVVCTMFYGRREAVDYCATALDKEDFICYPYREVFMAIREAWKRSAWVTSRQMSKVCCDVGKRELHRRPGWFVEWRETFIIPCLVKCYYGTPFDLLNEWVVNCKKLRAARIRRAEQAAAAASLQALLRRDRERGDFLQATVPKVQAIADLQSEPV